MRAIRVVGYAPLAGAPPALDSGTEAVIDMDTTTYDLSGISTTAIVIGGLFAVAIWVVFLIAYVKIISRAGYSGWWVLVMFVPILNIVMLLVFAFKEWPIQRELANCAAGPTRSSAAASRVAGSRAAASRAARRTRTRYGRIRARGRAREPRGLSGRPPALSRAAGLTKIAVPGNISPRSGDHCPHTPVEVLRPFRFDDVLQDEPGGDDLPDPIAHRAVVLDVGRHARARRPRRTATGRSTTGSRSAPPAPGRRETPSASGGSPRTPTARPVAAPGPPRASRPRGVGDERDRPEGREGEIETPVGERHLADVGLHQRNVDPGPAGGRRGVRQHPGRQVEARPPPRPAGARYRAQGADPQPTSRIRRPRTSPSRSDVRLPQVLRAPHEVGLAEELAVLGVVAVGVGVPPAPIRRPGGGLVRAPLARSGRSDDAGDGDAPGRVPAVSPRHRCTMGSPTSGLDCSARHAAGAFTRSGGDAVPWNAALWVCAVSEWSRPHSSGRHVGTQLATRHQSIAFPRASFRSPG